MLRLAFVLVILVVVLASCAQGTLPPLFPALSGTTPAATRNTTSQPPHAVASAPTDTFTPAPPSTDTPTPSPLPLDTPLGKAPIDFAPILQQYPLPTDGAYKELNIQPQNLHAIAYVLPTGKVAIAVASLEQGHKPVIEGATPVALAWPVPGFKGTVLVSVKLVDKGADAQGALSGIGDDGTIRRLNIGLLRSELQATAAKVEAPEIDATIRSNQICFRVGAARYCSVPAGSAGAFGLSDVAQPVSFSMVQSSSAPAGSLSVQQQYPQEYETLQREIELAIAQLRAAKVIDSADFVNGTVQPMTCSSRKSQPDVDLGNVVSEMESPDAIKACDPTTDGTCKPDLIGAAIWPPLVLTGAAPGQPCPGDKNGWLDVGVVRVLAALPLQPTTVPAGYYLLQAQTGPNGLIAVSGNEAVGARLIGVREAAPAASSTPETFMVPGIAAPFVDSTLDQGTVEIASCKWWIACLFWEWCRR